MTELVVVDRWDREDLASCSVLYEFMRGRDDLEATITGGGALLDGVFYVLLKASPELAEVPPHLKMVGTILAEVCLLDSVEKLRRTTIGDPFLAAKGAAALARRIRAVLDRLGRITRPDFETVSALVASLVAEAAEEAAEAIGDVEAVAGAWGVERGSLRHLPVEERQALSNLLDSKRVRRIADLFGRMRAASFAEPAVASDARDEIRDLEQGADLARTIGSEWLTWSEAGLQELFLARLADGELLQVEMTGEDTLALGGIILCVDGSSSMSRPLQGFTREMWAQAFKLLLLRQAQRQGRPLHVIDFGSAGEFQHVAFETASDFSPERVLSTAGAYFGGGTHFETPMALALKLAEGAPEQRADVVFVSDGECRVHARFEERYRAKAAELGMRTWGVVVAASGAFPFADKVWSIQELSGGAEVAEMLTRMN